MTTIIQEGKAEGIIQEGKAEGLAEGKKITVIGFLKQGILSAEQIAEASELSLEEVLKIKEGISSHN